MDIPSVLILIFADQIQMIRCVLTNTNDIYYVDTWVNLIFGF